VKKLIAIVMSVVLVALLVPGLALADKPVEGYKGNGLPKGYETLYKMNIIGAPGEKVPGMLDDSGKRIFVNLQGNTKIYLTESADFDIIDANGTDSDGAEFSLPNPDPDQDGITWYSVFIRLRGKPNKSIEFVTTAELGGETYVGGALVRVRETGKGKNSFENVSKELLYVYVTIGGVTKRVPIFSPNLAGATWYWDVTNWGCKIVQVVFVEMPTTTGDDVWPPPS
jgi:hypothetical protein